MDNCFLQMFLYAIILKSFLQTISKVITLVGTALIGKVNLYKKKSRIRETKHLSTDADSSADAIGGDGLG